LELTTDQIKYDILKDYLGVPYIWGGSNRQVGLDCSGFVIDYLSVTGRWPRGRDATAQGIYVIQVGAGASVPAKPGFEDLLFFGKDKTGISHIGIALNENFMIEAGGGDSTCTNVAAAKAKNACVKISAIKRRSDLVAVLRLPAAG
jgi:lipoprotein Spr